MESSRQEYWSGLPFPTPGDLLDPGIEPMSLVSPAMAGGFSTTVPQLFKQVYLAVRFTKSSSFLYTHPWTVVVQTLSRV